MFISVKKGINKKLTVVLTYTVILLALITFIVIIGNQFELKWHEEKEDHKYHDSQSSNEMLVHDKYETGFHNESSKQECETIHIAIVCGGFNSTRSFYILLKSILFYKTDVINLHIFVDDVSHLILKELFQSWDLPDLEVNYYKMTEYEHEITWITSHHYSHRYGLMKLVLLSVLSEATDISRAILLDTDILVLGNIRDLWNEMLNSAQEVEGSKDIFGMVENQSDWYMDNSQLTKGRNVWPAIGRGFNSGVILIDFVQLRLLNWRLLWRQVAESELITHLSTSLADQDILNAVVRSHSYLVFRLPCWFNLQLNDHTNLDIACPFRNGFKVIHWNSPYKLESRNSKTRYYRNWYNTFINWNGNLLRQGLCDKNSNLDDRADESDKSTNSDDLCKDIRPRPSERLRTYLYFLEFEHEPSDWDVTLVVHLSLDRIQVLDQLAFNWPGPISVAIYMQELETDLLLTSIQNGNNLAQRRNIGYHLVFRDHGFNYPINRLRNIALNNAITPYVFLSDIDFIPSKNLYGYLLQTISEMANQSSIDPLAQTALVVPAFENFQYKFDFPATKMELLNQINLGSVTMFRDQIWPQGQAPTDYAKWRATTKSYKVDWRPEYEPFVVTSRIVPKFDERFVGFGWNKVENIMQMAALNYTFIVLPEAFVIHKFHSASYDIMRHRESLEYRACTMHLRRTFLIELKMKYPKFFQSMLATDRP